MKIGGGISDRTSFEAIDKAAEQHRILPTIYSWISSMLESRPVMTTLIGENLKVSMAIGGNRLPAGRSFVACAVEPGGRQTSYLTQ